MKMIMGLLTGPLAIALLVVTLLFGGVAGGVVIAGRMEAAEKKRQQDAREAAQAALRGPPKPERVPLVESGSNPFAPRYVPLGEPLHSNFIERNRVLIVEISLVTQRGEKAEALMQAEKLPMRARTLALLSEFPLAVATREDGSRELARLLREALNAQLQVKSGFAPVDEVMLTRYYVQ
jgi:flagellar basal body-associated protein FliL